jgi:AraC-like DNA-binding protein
MLNVTVKKILFSPYTCHSRSVRPRVSHQFGREGAVAIGAPAVIAWNGQYEFGRQVMHLGVLAPLLPVALEGSVLYSARLAHEAIEADQPAGRYRAMTWVQAGIASCLNVWHGLTAAGHGLHRLVATDYQVGVALGLTSLLGIGLLELTVALKQRKQRARTAAQTRQALIRRLRFPRLSAEAAAISAARGIATEEAWRAAWIDRYGVGPEATRRARRTARKILARQQHADRDAASAGDLTIRDGVIVRAETEPTDAEREAGILEAAFADEIEAWLADREPPEAGSASSLSGPDTDGPQGSTKSASDPRDFPPPEADQIRDEQRNDRPDRTGHTARSRSGAEARRARGAQTRRRIADHLAAHPDHKPKQIAEALGLGVTTVKRHLRAITDEGTA